MCLSYGLDTDAFAAIVPVYYLRHAALTGAFGSLPVNASSARVIKHCQALFGVLEALCHCRLTPSAGGEACGT